MLAPIYFLTHETQVHCKLVFPHLHPKPKLKIKKKLQSRLEMKWYASSEQPLQLSCLLEFKRKEAEKAQLLPLADNTKGMRYGITAHGCVH